jgi:hypothetical protein
MDMLPEPPQPAVSAPFEAPPPAPEVPAASGSAARLAEERMHTRIDAHVNFFMVFLPWKTPDASIAPNSRWWQQL